MGAAISREVESSVVAVPLTRHHVIDVLRKAGLPEMADDALRELAMHPSGRTGVRFVLANPSDPSRLDEFSDWYDSYSAAITVPGYLASDAHFENPGASGQNNSPRYATIYDKDPPSPPDGSRYSRPTTPTPLHAYPHLPRPDAARILARALVSAYTRAAAPRTRQ
jgi:hypothetical protein